MSQTRKSRGVRATGEGLQKLQQAKAAKRNDKGKPWTYFDVATAAEVDEKTVQRFFRGEAKDRNYAIAIVQALDLDITEVVDPKEWNPVEQTFDAIDWREVCGKVLARQRENQRLRRQATERGFELNVYVPLGLVERKQQQRRRGDVPLEEVYQLTKEVITKEYDNDKFLTEVIEPGKSKRIAIIGEPGAGKTTLQEKIAVWIHENNKGLPICIPLGGLQGKSLEDYLLQIWLKAALRFIEPDALGVEVQAFASLQKQFREEQVWLLLDGVDEMAANSPIEALATIKEQLTDWLVEARVVLTCRLNVWDANVKNMLTGFETYRTLEFKPEQVEDFIRQWFAEAGKADPPQPPLKKGEQENVASVPPLSKGKELLRKLQETGRERIRELVRNPLRLSLLCQTSYLLPVDEPLPETKAALYERFTRYFYEWKQEQHLDLTQQDELIDELHEALGKLALPGINSAARFRLGRKFARQEMGDRLFNLACRLGWLNLVDRDAKTDEAVYAFFHPTFQEYFAACAIDDWRYFLNHVPDNPKQGIYRIFEAQWKEVILLWLGRNNLLFDQKEVFIGNLLTFEDKCNFFYWVRAWFLVAEGLAEFSESSFIDRVLAQIVQHGFGFDIEKQTWTSYIDCFKEDAREVLRKTDSIKVSEALRKLLDTIDQLEQVGYWKSDRFEMANFHRCEVTANLVEIDIGRYEVIDILISIIQSSKDNFVICSATESLSKITPNNPIITHKVLDNFIELLENNEDESVIREIIKLLGLIGFGKVKAINALTKFITRKQTIKKDLALEIADSLIKIESNESKGVNILFYFLLTPQDGYFLKRLVRSFIEAPRFNNQVIQRLNDVLDRTNDPALLLYIAEIIAKVDSNNWIKATEILISLLDDSFDEVIRLNSAEVLVEIGVHQSKSKLALEKLLKSKDVSVRLMAAYLLGRIDPDNLEAIKTLIKLVDSCTPVASSYLESMNLGKFKAEAITALAKVVEFNEDELMKIWAAKSLEKIEPRDLRSVHILIHFLKNGKKEFIQEASVESLISFIRREQLIVIISELRDYLDEIRQNDYKSYNICQKVVWHCAKNLSYPDFYQAWHQTTVQ